MQSQFKTIQDVITDTALNDLKLNKYNFWFRLQVARRNLTNFVIQKSLDITRMTGVNFEDSDTAPESLEQVTQAWEHSLKTGEPYKVYSGNSRHTIYTNYHGNLAFRFWHDYLHYKNQKGFDFESELIIGSRHVESIGIHFGSHSLELKLMWIDTIKQTEFHKENSKFVDNQLLFAIEQCKLMGLIKCIS